MKFAKLALIASAATVSLAGATGANAASFQDFNLFVLGNMNAQNSDIEGGLAVGGNASLVNYAVHGDAVAGGNFTTTNVQFFSDATLGGTFLGGGHTVVGTETTSASSLPVDFAAESSLLTGLSNSLASLSATGPTNVTGSGYSVYTVLADTTGLNVFDIDLSSGNGTEFHITASAPDAFVLFNVSGTTATLQNGDFFYSGIDASHVLFNFSDATSITISGLSVQGSILAPKATLYAENGHANGNVVIDTLAGRYSAASNYEFHTGYGFGGFPPLTPAVPEPATWALMIMGFGLVGGAMRRRTFAFAA